jgi:predicted nucleotidyltransferase
MDTADVLHRIRPSLEAAFGPRLKGILLYGSEARHESLPDSDVDIMVLLDDPVRFGRDLEMITRALYPLQLEMPDRPLHAIPVSERAYLAGESGAYRVAREEGVLL